MGVAARSVNAAGRAPFWIIPESAITTAPDSDNPSISLSAVTDGVQADCYANFGGVELSRSPNTVDRQRMCQKVIEQIAVSETIEGTLIGTYDQQTLGTSGDEANAYYEAVVEGSRFFLFQAFGHDSDDEPTADTLGDLWRLTAQTVVSTQPTSAEEDVRFTATVSGDGFWKDTTLTSAA